MHKFYASLNNNLSRFIKYYEELIGIKELRIVQTNVIKTEQEFLQSQNNRRHLQSEINKILAKRSEINADLENTPRGQKKFLQLVTEEHEIITQENELRAKLETAENHERETFAYLSSKLRESHEKERSQSEKTKYWSLAGSIIGATIGILGASINSYIRNKEIRRVLNRMEYINNKDPVANENNLSDKHNHLMTLLTNVNENLESLHKEIPSPINSFENKLETLNLTLGKLEKLQLKSNYSSEARQDFIDTNDNEKLRHIVVGSTSLLCFSLAFMILYLTFSSASDALL